MLARPDIALVSRAEFECAAETEPRRQRADGAVRLRARRAADGRTAIVTRYQQGSLRLRTPRVFDDGPPEAILINTAGGLTGGDRMSVEAAAEDGASLVIATQACERIYRAQSGEAQVSTTLTLGRRTRLDWLPQETILFDRSRLRRSLTIDMADDAALLAVEPVIFGRSAMGEEVRCGAFRDRWRIRRGGTLVYADDTRIDGAVVDILDRPATLGGARAMATLIYAGPDADERRDAAREFLAGADAIGGASAFDGVLAIRLAARDGRGLRAALVPLLDTLRPGRTLPRVWFC